MAIIAAILELFRYIPVVDFMKIEEAIKQERFISEFQKAHLNILYTAAWLTYETTQMLKPFGITWQQFNVLRILRGRRPKPATVKLLTERMIDKMSNASRLVDKLVKKGLVERQSCESDRRQVDVFLTEKGLELVNSASAVIDSRLHGSNIPLTDEESTRLNEFLDRMRNNALTEIED